MSVPSAWTELEITDLPNEDLQWVAKTHGIDVAVSIWRRCAGTHFEFPTRFPKGFAIRFIRRHWDRTNTRQLARSLELSERTVQQYLNERPDAMPAMEQLSIFSDPPTAEAVV